MRTKKASKETDLGLRVRALRKAMGVSQERLGELGGLKRSVVNKIEAGENQATSFPMRQGLAAAFGLSIEDSNAYLNGTISLDDVRRIQDAAAVARGETNGHLPGWPEAEAAARLMKPDVEPYEFMGARLRAALRPANGVVDVLFVIGAAWMFRGDATEEEKMRAREAERRERPTSSAPPGG
jgi:transcriptional regulator with XRE-family HTH domain